MEGTTVFTPFLEELKHIKSEDGGILTKPFLNACKHFLPVHQLCCQFCTDLLSILPDKFGPSMQLVKNDVGGNISKLESKYLSCPTGFTHLYAIVHAEVKAKTEKDHSGCTTALLWLTRTMDFILEVFRNLLQNAECSLSRACKNAYKKTLRRSHNWIEIQSFQVGLKVIPDRKKFAEVVGDTDAVKSDMEKFCTSFAPLLEENHKFFASIGLEDRKDS